MLTIYIFHKRKLIPVNLILLRVDYVGDQRCLPKMEGYNH